jgi:uncharacterized protein (TIGR00299 family) protein
MKTVYLECNMGASGDMLTAALLELHPDPAGFLARLNGLHIPSVEISAQRAVKCGITGTRVSVRVNGEEEGAVGRETPAAKHHCGMREIGKLVSQLEIPGTVRDDVMAVYGLLADAESCVHGQPVPAVHFHEIGTMDAVADIVSVCLLFHELAPERVLASPVCVGSGEVRCAHGILPVPAPATALLLRGVPIYGGTVRGELCTPTGAALLKHFVSDFGPMPVMRTSKIGYGMGSHDFGTANCVRSFLGEADDGCGSVVELCCNLDDMTPESVAFAEERLWEGGALDVYTTAIQMKKNRPGILLSCLCRREQREAMIRLIFRHTTTLGVRETAWDRCTLARSERTVRTEYGPVRVKQAEGWGVRRAKPEYDDLARIAREQNLPLEEVRALAEKSDHV